jgi:hypothetical protein
MSKHAPIPGFSNIPLRDLPIWVKVFKKEGVTSAEEIQKELILIDDLLSLQKRGRKDLLRERIEKESGYTKKQK